MAISTQPKCDVYGKLTLIDGSDPIVTLVLGFDNGDFSVSGLRGEMNEVTPIQRRGRHIGEIHGARTYAQISLTSILMSTTHAAAADGSLVEMILKRGAFSTSEGTGAQGGPRLLDLRWEVEGTRFGDENDIDCLFKGVDFVLDVSEGQPTTISINGTVYRDIQGDLAAAGVALT